jgi:hypothetical protein
MQFPLFCPFFSKKAEETDEKVEIAWPAPETWGPKAAT